jgi:serine/threonine protein kinase
MENLVGRVFQERYRIQSLLGRQRGRRTFLARDRQAEQPVVIKLLLFDPDFSWDDLKLFEREAEVLKSLDHPFIPKYLDYFEVETELGKGFALVQTYIEARSLQDWVESGRSFGEAEITAIAAKLLNILQYLHHRQPPVVHRDIKPSNILLCDRSAHQVGQVYLIDFGSVQTAVSGGTRTVVGTYGYMPPEQFGGMSTPASDLYALGATLIYLAAGQHPDQLPHQEMRIFFEDRVTLSPDRVDWLKWLTEPSVERRLKSATQALEALEQPQPQAASLARVTKPADSRIQVTNTRQSFEILIPPRGFNLGLIPIIGFAIPWNAFLVVWFRIALASWSSFGWFMAIFAIGHLGIGLGMIWAIVFCLLGRVRLRMTPSDIVLTHEIFGLKSFPRRRANRRSITKIEHIRPGHRRDSDGDTVAVPPQINIWAGTQKFSIGGSDWPSAAELDWLAQDLSQWLELPIERG